MGADIFCWQAEADGGSPRTAYKNTVARKQLQTESPLSRKKKLFILN